MNTEKYNELISDNSVIKFSGIAAITFLENSKYNIVIEFAFCHLGLNNLNYSAKPKSRIKLSISKITNEFLKLTEGIQLLKIDTEIRILANSDRSDYALLFDLIIDETNRIISVTLLEEPELGISYLTNEEINGIK